MSGCDSLPMKLFFIHALFQENLYYIYYIFIPLYFNIMIHEICLRSDGAKEYCDCKSE